MFHIFVMVWLSHVPKYILCWECPYNPYQRYDLFVLTHVIICFQSSNCSTRKSVTCIIFTHKLCFHSVIFYKNACEQNPIIGICICQHALYYNPIISHILVHICGMKKLNSGNELLMRFKWIDSMNFINA